MIILAKHVTLRMGERLLELLMLAFDLNHSLLFLFQGQARPLRISLHDFQLVSEHGNLAIKVIH